MSQPIKKPNQHPESYSPKKPEIANMLKEAVKNSQSENLPMEFIITPKDKIAEFTEERWPYSNVEPAVYSALGLFYGVTEKRNEAGELINDDIEYSVFNVLSGHGLGLFYCLPDDSLSMEMYGFSSCYIDINDYTEEEIITIIKDQIYRGNAVHIDEGNGNYDYLIWGYRDNGNILLGYKFEHGNDNLNCSFDFSNPVIFDSLTKIFADNALFHPNGERLGGITFYQPGGEKQTREVVYKKALIEGYRMLTQTTPPLKMDSTKVHFGYGQAVYDVWIKLLEQANAENNETFYFSSPIFPHFLALYENRLHLYKFMKICADMYSDESLKKAVDLVGELKDLAVEGAQISYENEYSNPEILAMTNNERRTLLIDLLKKCRVLELEIADNIKEFIDNPHDYNPKKPEIAGMMTQKVRCII